MYSPAALPSTTRAAPAKNRMLSTVNSTSKSAVPFGLPTFACSRLERVSASPSMASAKANSAFDRSCGVDCDQLSKAARAAATARSTSEASPFGTCAISSSVAGLITAIVSPEAASVRSPSMNICGRVAVSVMVGPRRQVMRGRGRSEPPIPPILRAVAPDSTTRRRASAPDGSEPAIRCTRGDEQQVRQPIQVRQHVGIRQLPGIGERDRPALGTSHRRSSEVERCAGHRLAGDDELGRLLDELLERIDLPLERGRPSPRSPARRRRSGGRVDRHASRARRRRRRARAEGGG